MKMVQSEHCLPSCIYFKGFIKKKKNGSGTYLNSWWDLKTSGVKNP